MELESTTSQVQIHRDGDTILVVGDEVYCKELLVSAPMLSNISEPFFNMLSNPIWNK